MRDESDEVTEWADARAGSSVAFAAVYDRHRERVYRLALRLSENRHDAEDVTASAFLELWRRRTDVRLVGGSVLPGTYALGRGGASVTVPPSEAVAARSSDPSAPSAATTAYLELFQLDESGTSFTITTSSPTLRWTAVLTWVSKQTTEWATNASGQTYGVLNDKGAPDLIAVTATNGRDGYVFRKDLDDADGTTASKSFASPQDAVDWQKAHQGKHVYIPVYESDGTTKIGVFQASGP